MEKFFKSSSLWILSSVLISCTRAGIDSSSQIILKIPDQVISSDISSLPPAINCFFVAVAGPEPEMRRNTCERIGPSASTYQVGTWAGGFPRNSEVALDVPSGKDRVIFLAGFEAPTSADCNDFRVNGFPQFDPEFYYLGKAGDLDLEAGKVVSVPLTVNYDSSDIVENCRGPDFPNDQNQGPYMRIEGIGLYESGTDTDRATRDFCYQVRLRLFEGMGNPWPNLGAANIEISGFSADFHNAPGCSGGTPTSVSIPPMSNSSSFIYYRPSTVSAFSGMPLMFSGTPIMINFDQNFVIGEPKVGFVGPSTANAGTCELFQAEFQKFENNDPLPAPAGGILLQLTENASFRLRDNATCNGGNTVGIAPATTSQNIYFQFISSGVSFDLFDYVTITSPATGVGVKPFVIQEPN